MKKRFSLFIAIVLIGVSASAQIIRGTYAIQNTSCGKNLRPYEAGGQNGNRIVLYDHVEWKCMTWDFMNVGENIYQLRNLFTSKTFQPAGAPVKDGLTLEQQPLSKIPEQQWEFIKVQDNDYFIRLKGTELYITASSDKTNGDIILQGKKDKSLQQWRLVAQDPKN